MKRLAALALIMLFVVSSTGCRRGLRLWGLRGAPCQPGGAAAGPFAGGGLGSGLGGGGGLLGQGTPGQQMMAPPMAAPTCCPPACPPIDCGCATQGSSFDPAYAGSDISGGVLPGSLVSDSGFDLREGETLGQVGPTTGVDITASAPLQSFAPAPANVQPTLQSLPSNIQPYQGSGSR